MRTQYAFRRPVANSYLVRERDRRRWRDLGLVLLAVVPLVLALLSYTWIHLQVLETGYRIDAQERDLQGLLEEERMLRMQAARLTNPTRLDRLARERLELSPPKLGQMVFVDQRASQ